MKDNQTKRTAIITIEENGDQFTVNTVFDPQLPENQTAEEMTVCQAAALTALMSIQMWWQNIANEQKEDAQKEGNNWTVWTALHRTELITRMPWGGWKTSFALMLPSF